MIDFYAKDWMDPDGIIVASGERLTQQILPALRRGESVLIRVAEMEGLSSSYFNMIFNIVRDELGPTILKMVSFDGLSPMHRSMVDRSLVAAMNFPVRTGTQFHANS